MNLPIDDAYSISDIQPGDKPAYLEYLQEKQIYDQTFNIPYPYTEADADWWLNHVAETTKNQNGISVNWAIREKGGRLVGGIGFHGFEIGKSHRAEIGYWLAKPFWSKGIMTKAVKASSIYAFKELGLSRITANVFDFNIGSAKVLEKSGYQCEGILRSHYNKDGKIFDGKMYALTIQDVHLNHLSISHKNKNYVIRPVVDADIPAIRKLVNAAYQELADMGLNYTATYQDDVITRDRVSKGRAFALTDQDAILGTVLFAEQNYFTKRRTGYVSQLAIAPSLKKSGLGSLLMDLCEEIAAREKFEGIQLDTAKPAKHLVEWYQKRGYEIVGETRWDDKTYESWIFEKSLRSQLPRPEFIKHYTEIQDLDNAHYPDSDELLSIGSPFAKKFGLTNLGIHHEILPPGRRTSWPHAESEEEEFVYVIDGNPDAWIDGHLYRLNPGDAVGFVPGTGICHTFLNNTQANVHLLVVGEATKKTNKCFYALHPKRNEQAKKEGWLWEDPPHQALGNHDGRPDAQKAKS